MLMCLKKLKMTCLINHHIHPHPVRQECAKRGHRHPDAAHGAEVLEQDEVRLVGLRGVHARLHFAA